MEKFYYLLFEQMFFYIAAFGLAEWLLKLNKSQYFYI